MVIQFEIYLFKCPRFDTHELFFDNVTISKNIRYQETIPPTSRYLESWH